MHNSHAPQKKLLGYWSRAHNQQEDQSVCWIKLPILKVLIYLEYFIKNLFVVETNWDFFLLGATVNHSRIENQTESSLIRSIYLQPHISSIFFPDHETR